jgi:hypothetical protein
MMAGIRILQRMQELEGLHIVPDTSVYMLRIAIISHVSNFRAVLLFSLQGGSVDIFVVNSFGSAFQVSIEKKRI